MSCSYFILSKDKILDTTNNSKDNLVSIKDSINYILPRNLLNCYFNDGLFESGLIEWSKQFCHTNKNILDIGAHTGTYSLSMASKCKHVFAFEPQKMTYYALCGSVALSNCKNITCINKGLGSSEQLGTITLNIISNDGGGSTVKSVESQNLLATEEIEIITLDSMNISNISFIKIDVEDNEKAVIEGGVETIKRCNYPHILIECNNKYLHEDLFSLLKGLGYNITPIAGMNNMYLAHKK